MGRRACRNLARHPGPGRPWNLIFSQRRHRRTSRRHVSSTTVPNHYHHHHHHVLHRPMMTVPHGAEWMTMPHWVLTPTGLFSMILCFPSFSPRGGGRVPCVDTAFIVQRMMDTRYTVRHHQSDRATGGGGRARFAGDDEKHPLAKDAVGGIFPSCRPRLLLSQPRRAPHPLWSAGISRQIPTKIMRIFPTRFPSLVQAQDQNGDRIYRRQNLPWHLSRETTSRDSTLHLPLSRSLSLSLSACMFELKSLKHFHAHLSDESMRLVDAQSNSPNSWCNTRLRFLNPKRHVMRARVLLIRPCSFDIICTTVVFIFIPNYFCDSLFSDSICHRFVCSGPGAAGRERVQPVLGGAHFQRRLGCLLGCGDPILGSL